MENLHFAHSTMNSKEQVNASQRNAVPKSDGFLWKFTTLCALVYLIWSDRIQLVFSPTVADAPMETAGAPVRASLLEMFATPKKAPEEPVSFVELPPGDMNNLTLAIDPGFARRYNVPEAELSVHTRACDAYIKRFAPVAVAEMRKFGIPASITLAQALLESNAGESSLAKKANNHFGIKCFSRKCKKGHCVNQTDDSHKDFFVAFPNVWGSFREHSNLLAGNKRYKTLFDLPPADYRAWASGLQDAGYATDEQYAEKLCAIIQNLKLYRYDRR